MPNQGDLSDASPWLASLRESRARRFAANRTRRRRWSGRTGAAVALGTLSIAAGGALAQGTGGAAAGQTSTQTSQSTVVAVQRALGITADGIYGPQTRRAVRRFQRAHGLAVDGIIGPQTLAALGIRGGGDRRLTAAPASANPAATLRRIALCESGGNPVAVSADGRYRGKYQFSRATWRALGGKGDPAKADEATQDALAAKLLAARGTAPWPNCA